MKKFFLAFCLIMFFSFQLKADGPPVPSDPDDCGDACDESEHLPLDDHVAWLIGASATFGIIFLRSRSQKA